MVHKKEKKEEATFAERERKRVLCGSQVGVARYDGCMLVYDFNRQQKCIPRCSSEPWKKLFLSSSCFFPAFNSSGFWVLVGL